MGMGSQNVMVNFIWFTDEKLFTVAAPNNTQYDRVYAPAGVRKKQIAAGRLLRTRPTFSPSIMVSVGVSALGQTSIHLTLVSKSMERTTVTYC